MLVTDLYLLFLLSAAFILVVVFVRRRSMVYRAPPRDHLEPGERFEEALEDMRLRGSASPEELSAQAEAARETGAPPPRIPGFPQTPEDARRQRQEGRERTEE
jgi:hypothetical protein